RRLPSPAARDHPRHAGRGRGGLRRLGRARRGAAGETDLPGRRHLRAGAEPRGALRRRRLLDPFGPHQPHPRRTLRPADGGLHRRRRRGGSGSTDGAPRAGGGGLMFDNIDWPGIGRATLDTLLMLGGSLALTVLFGVPLGVLLYLSGKGRLAASPLLNAVVSFVVNVLRSVP